MKQAASSMLSMFSRRLASLLAVILVFVARLVSAQQQPTAAEAQRQLLRLTVPDSMQTDVPGVIQDAISNFKKALVLQSDAVVARLPARSTTAVAKQHLSEALPAASVGKISDEQWRKLGEENSRKPIAGLYGGELTLSVSQPKPSLLLVQESFHFACGNDTVLLAYGNTSGAWKRILLWESKPYDQISGAFGDTYETLLLRPEHDNHPLLLVLHGTPWCTSTMSSFDMDVFELGSSAAAAPLWHGEHGYRRLDLDPPLTVRPTADGFEVRTSVSGGGENVSRKGVMRYSVTATGVHRVEPLAMNGRDSVVEWLELPRKEAAEFADEPGDSLTWQMFEKFSPAGKRWDSTVPLPTVGSVRACRDSKTHYQAEVTSQFFDGSAKGSRPGPGYFVQLRKVTKGYRIHAVTPLPESTCTGPDLMAAS